MEEERKGKPAAAIGGMYAKAKQRVLNKIGRRTTLTKNPRVDFISKRVEEIKGKKTEVTRLATTASSQLSALQTSVVSLNRAMLDAFRDELGDRRWDEATSSYIRVLHPEEKRLVADMERSLARSMQTMDKVIEAYQNHLTDVANKPLTFNTPEEESRLSVVVQTKDEYKEVRTMYSDAMIDADAQLATGAEPSVALQQHVDEAKKRYEDMSERLCDDALKYEHIYREELSQRVSAHFTAEQRLLRGVSTAMRDFYPYTSGLTLDWQDMRSARRAALMKRDPEDVELARQMDASLPHADSAGAGSSSSFRGGGGGSGGGGVGNPFGDDDTAAEYGTRGGASGGGRSVGGSGVGGGGGGSAMEKASKTLSSASAAAAAAASEVSSAVKSKSKNLSGMLAAYAPAGKGSAKGGGESSSRQVGDDGLSNIKL